MTTLPNMNLILPTLGGDVGTWDDKLDAIFRLLDPHDHTSGKGVRVPTAGINIDADLAYGGFAATGLGSLAFNAVAALSSGSKRLFVSSSDNELYWRTNGGTNVKVTSGSGLNITLVGGIVGDYSSVGAEVAYDDANDRYTFKQQSGTWAKLHAGGLRLAEFNTTESVYVQILAPSVLAASYDITLPSALPGSQCLVQIDASGNLVFSTSNITLPNNQSITFSGTGDVKHGDRVITIPIVFPNHVLTSGTSANNGANIGTTVNASSSIQIPLWGLREGDRVKSIVVQLDSNTGSNTTYQFHYGSCVAGTPAFTAVNNATTSNTATVATVTVTGSGYQLGSGEAPFLGVATDAGGAVVVCTAKVTYDRP